MKTYLRFADLRSRGIIASWPMLRRRVERDGFPCGVKAGPNTRIWEEGEVEAWIATRSSDRKPAPRRRKTADRKAETLVSP